MSGYQQVMKQFVEKIGHVRFREHDGLVLCNLESEQEYIFISLRFKKRPCVGYFTLKP